MYIWALLIGRGGGQTGRGSSRQLQTVLSLPIIASSPNDMNQRAITDAIAQLQAKGDVCIRQVIIEQRRVDDITAVSVCFVQKA